MRMLSLCVAVVVALGMSLSLQAADEKKPAATKPIAEKKVDAKKAVAESKPAAEKPTENKKPTAEKKPEPAPVKQPAPAKQPAASKNADPFDGKTLDGWVTQDGKPVTAGWEIVDGAIHLDKTSKQRAGNIVTAREYGDFDLSFEWKIATKGNSGIKYRVRPYNGKTLGCEYQIYDDVGTKTSLKSKNSSGSLYDLFEPSDAKKLKPAGEYNTARIVLKGQHVEHWLNGEKIVDVTIGDAEWKKRVAESKFDDVRDFSLEPGGKLMLTDHGSEVWYRNFKFVASPAPPPKPKPQPVRKTYVYKKVGDHEIKLDVEIAGERASRPVVVWIHGGALINGHRESVPAWLRETIVEEGLALVSIDYRLAPETKLPEIMADVEDAFKWIRKEGPKLFDADPDRVAVAGGSAGGYLALSAGQRVEPKLRAVVSLWGYGDLGAPWTFEASRYERHNKAEFAAEDASKIVTGPTVSDSRERKNEAGAYYQWLRRTGGWAEAVSGWKPQRDVKKFAAYMPEFNVKSDYPPTLLIHGDEDTDVPFACSERMAAQYKRLKVEHRLFRIAGAEHGLSGADPKKITEANYAAVTFLLKKLGK